MATEVQTSGSPDHLCVLVHGLWGNPVHLSSLATGLQAQHPTDRLHILVAKRNSNSFTYDGIELGGERITQEIEEKMRELEESGSKIKKLSIAGYSLGGLIARYAIGLLYKNGLFDTIEPMNFTTFATPHLGIPAPIKGAHSHLWNYLGARTLSTSGQQMFLIDSFRDTNRPLLSVMSDPQSIFMRGLGRFGKRSIYANIINDRSVPWYTSSISSTDPYVDLESIDLHYLPDQDDDVILDPNSPCTPKRRPELTLAERTSKSVRGHFSALPLYALLSVLLPIGATFYLVNSGIQTYRSMQRVRLHESGQAGIGIGRYRIPLLEQAQTHAYEALSGDQGEEYLPTPPPEPHSTTGKPAPFKSSNDEKAELARREGSKDQSPFPTLALTPEQFEMIDHLDCMGITKYPVHIKKVGHSHAAIIRRTEKESFAEGKTVSAHWATNFEC